MRRLVTIVFWSINPTCQCVKEGVACENREKCELLAETQRYGALRMTTISQSDRTCDIADSFSHALRS